MSAATMRMALACLLLAGSLPAASRPGERGALPESEKPFSAERPQHRRDREIDVERVLIEIEPDISSRSFAATAEQRFRVLVPELPALTLDAKELRIARVRDAGGRDLGFEHAGDKLKIKFPKPLKEGERAAVRIEYSGGTKFEGLNFYRKDARYPGDWDAVWSKGEPEFNSRWAPLWDYPNEQSASEVTVIVPEGFSAVSNGRLASEGAGPRPGTRRFHWVQDKPHVAYLIAFYAARFAKVSDKARLADGREVPVAYWVPPGREEDGRRTFAKTPAMLAAFSELLGFPYPWDKYDQVINQYAGGMENTSASSIGDRFLCDSRAMLDSDSDGLIAHELAHQWFGNVVTCKDWSHIWLNEGFASFLDAWWFEKDRGFDDFARELDESAQWYFSETGRYRRPMVSDRYRHPRELFDAHTYARGAWTLQMLRRELGEERFWASVRRFLKDRAHQVVDSEDLRRAIEAETGRSMTAFFAQWVYGAHHPELKLVLEYDWKHRRLSLDVLQQQVKKGHPAFAFKLPLRLPDGAALEAKVERERQRFSWDVAARPAWVAVDPGLSVLAQTTREWPRDMLTAELAAGPTGQARARAALELAKAGTPGAAAALAECLRKDPFWGAGWNCAQGLGRIGGPQALSALLAHVRHKHPKVRRAVAAALSKFPGRPEVYDALEPLARADESWAVQNEALRTLGAVRDPRARALLESRLRDDSWNELVRGGALDGLGELRDAAALPALAEWSAPGRAVNARARAMSAWARAGQGRADVREGLVRALTEEDHLQVWYAALSALQSLGDPLSIPALARAVTRAPHDFAVRVPRAIEAIRESRKARVEELQRQADALSRRVEALESRLEK